MPRPARSSFRGRASLWADRSMASRASGTSKVSSSRPPQPPQGPSGDLQTLPGGPAAPVPPAGGRVAAAIVVEDATKVIDGVTVLDRVSFTAEPGRVTAFL